MKAILLTLIVVIVLASCGDNVSPGGPIPGPTGPAGPSGHSLVSEYIAPTVAECSNGGSRMDIYLDLDDSLSVSEGDDLIGSLLTCNGSPGLSGTTGPTGPKNSKGKKHDNKKHKDRD